MSKRVELFLSFVKIPTDVIAILLAFIVSYIVRGNSAEVYLLPYHEYLRMVYIDLPIWIIIFGVQGLYQIKYIYSRFEDVSRVAISVLAGWAFFIVYLAFLKTQESFVFPRLMLIYILILSFVFVVVGRLLIRFVRYLLYKAGAGRRRIMVIGTQSHATDLSRIFRDYRGVEINFVGYLAEPSIKTLVDELKKQRIDEIVIDNREGALEHMESYLEVIRQEGVMCHLIPNTFEVQSSNVLFNSIVGLPVLTLRPTPLDGWGRIVKRALDIVISGLAIIVLSPVMLITALLIRITDPGPVIYTQPRVARGLRKFTIFKFRTMRWKYCTYSGPSKKTTEQIMVEDFNRPDLAEEYRTTRKIKNDPRISPIGAFLRKSNIDELPQLFNVLKGDVSLVGPRPYLEEEVEHDNAKMLAVFTIKPGITGLWQISGRNEASFADRIRLDYYYVQNWSLWQDFIIVIKTALAVLSGSKGAY